MSLAWTQLPERERAVYWSTYSYLDGRLADTATVQWALQLSVERRAERFAIASVLHKTPNTSLSEPWATVWELIEESWLGESTRLAAGSASGIRRRIRGGERSASLIAEISVLVSPRLEVRRRTSMIEEEADPPTVPSDIVYATLTSEHPVKPGEIGLPEIQEITFLTALANALEARMRYGTDAGRRVGWDGTSHQLARLGLLRRVEFALARGT